MKRILFYLCFTCVFYQVFSQSHNLPWDNGALQVSANSRYLQHTNGSPFFWLGDTGWLLPERLNRDEAEYYLEQCKQAGFNVVQVQTINGVPAMNFYGQSSMPDGFDFSNINRPVYTAIGTTWILLLMPLHVEAYILVWSAFGEDW